MGIFFRNKLKICYRVVIFSKNLDFQYLSVTFSPSRTENFNEKDIYMKKHSNSEIYDKLE